MKAKDVFKKWIGCCYNSSDYEMYLIVPNEYEDKAIKLTSNLKKYLGSEFYPLYCNYKEKRFNARKEEVNCDLRYKNDDIFFLNLRARKIGNFCPYTIEYIDIYEQIQFNHFSIQDNKLIFVFELIKNKIEFVEF